MDFNDFYDYLLNLCDKLSHETNEQSETIDELQCKLNDAVNANKSFIKRMAKQAREINALYKELEHQKTEINRITMICEVKDDVAMDMREDLKRLEKENNELQNEYKKSFSENIRLSGENTNLRKNIEHLCDENIRLRHELNGVKNNANNKIY